jgi:ADP-sugar diphosphatase
MSNSPDHIFNTSFHDQPIPTPIPLHITCTNLTPNQLTTFPAFNNWFKRTLKNLALQSNPSHTFHSQPMQIHRIEAESVTWFSKTKIGFVKLQVKIQNYEGDGDGRDEKNERKRGQWLPGAVFLRGGSVAVLVLIKPLDPTKPTRETQNTQETEENEDVYAILTIQPRIAASSLAFPELPAGMLDDSANLSGKAAAEIHEETGLILNQESMINMSALASADMHLNPPSSSKVSTTEDPSSTLYEDVENSMYPSPGACDEFLPIYLCRKRLTPQHLDHLKGRATGLREEGEVVTVKVVPFGELYREAGRDGKALAALGLYYSLLGKKDGEGRAVLGEWPGELDREEEKK